MKFLRLIPRKVYRRVGLHLLSFLTGVFVTLNVGFYYENIPEVVVLDVPEPIVEVYDALDVSRITFYNPVWWQTDSTPEVSSCGPTVDRQIALSQDLFFDEYGNKHLCGVRVDVVTDDGLILEDYVINDTMNVRFTNTVDVMLPKNAVNEAFQLGVKEGSVIFKYD